MLRAPRAALLSRARSAPAAASSSSTQIVYLHQALLRFYYSDRDRPVKWWSGPAWLTKLAVLAVFLANSLFISVVYTTGAAIALARV